MRLDMAGVGRRMDRFGTRRDRPNAGAGDLRERPADGLREAVAVRRDAV